MRPLAVFFAILLLVGCKPPPTSDDAVVAELRAGVVATLDAMQVPADQRPSRRALDDTVGLLAIQSPPERQALVRSGGLGPDAVVQAARDKLFLFTRERPSLKPPGMLVWLTTNPQGLTTAQVLVLDALTSQLEREAKLKGR